MKLMLSLDYLAKTGLLFEINRAILHPLGLALAISYDDVGDAGGGGVVDNSDDPEGMIFTEESYNRGSEKLDKFMKEEGLVRLQTRLDVLGFVVQDTERVVEDTQLEDEENIEIQKSDETFPTISIPSGPQDIKKVETASLSIEERNAEIKKRHPRKDGTIESGDDIRPAEKDIDGNCNHVNLMKQSLTGGGSIKFCADCGQPLFDSDQ